MSDLDWELIEDRANRQIDFMETEGYFVLDLQDGDLCLNAVMQNGTETFAMEFHKDHYTQDGIVKPYQFMEANNA
jgi:hypothetical protein